jgi:hypothetical protein
MAVCYRALVGSGRGHDPRRWRAVVALPVSASAAGPQATGSAASHRAAMEAAGMLDPASVSTIRRFALCTGVVSAWWLATWAAGWRGGMAALAAMLLIAGATAGMFAVARGDRPCGASLDRWDEAAAYVGLAAIARAFS